MRKLFILGLSLALLCACEDENKTSCGTHATVSDLRGLDGCGFVFQLDDGSYVQPLIVLSCGTPPVPAEQFTDPLASFEFVAGKEVLIDFEQTKMGSTCMAGPVVKITCLTELPLATDD